MVLANGSLSSQSGGEGEIRKNIINADLVECIIAMPTQLFYTTQIPVSLWFINNHKKQTEKTLFIDARKMGTMVSRKLRELTEEDIKKIADTYTAFVDGTLEDVKGFCAIADTDEIEKQDYILTPGRYVGIEEQEDDGEPFEDKMNRLTSELSEMFAKSHELEAEIRKIWGLLDMKYDVYTMEEALDEIIDYRGKTPQKVDKGGVPTLSAKAIKNNCIDYELCYCISLDEYKRFMTRGMPKIGDVLLTTEAPLGMVARLDRDDIAIAQRLLTLRGKLEYWIMNIYFIICNRQEDKLH